MQLFPAVPFAPRAFIRKFREAQNGSDLALEAGMHRATIRVQVCRSLQSNRLLDHFIRSRAEDLREAGIDATVIVDSLTDSRGEVHLVTIELGGGSDPTVVQETNRDVFLAARDAFDIAHRWIAEPITAAWS